MLEIDPGILIKYSSDVLIIVRWISQNDKIISIEKVYFDLNSDSLRFRKHEKKTILPPGCGRQIDLVRYSITDPAEYDWWLKPLEEKLLFFTEKIFHLITLFLHRARTYPEQYIRESIQNEYSPTFNPSSPIIRK
jgi:hypothetical protein